jgi:hypothetical protein
LRIPAVGDLLRISRVDRIIEIPISSSEQSLPRSTIRILIDNLWNVNDSLEKVCDEETVS